MPVTRNRFIKTFLMLRSTYEGRKEGRMEGRERETNNCSIMKR
jgi:hypothetical protein